MFSNLTLMWLYVLLLGPEIWSPWRDKCRYGEEPAVAQEDETQDILHGCGLRGVQGRGRESAAGQYGLDLQKHSPSSTKDIQCVTLEFCLANIGNPSISENSFYSTISLSQQYLLLCYDSGLDLFQGSSQDVGGGRNRGES